MLIPLDDAVPRVLIDSATDLMQQSTMPALADSASVETQMQPSIGAWLEAAYVFIGCGLGLRALLGVALSLRILARASPTRPDWAAGLRVRLSRDVAGPVTIAHTIVLPTDVTEWPAETRQAVLAHEYAHVARMDYAMLVVSQLNRAVFWFSPLSWWLHRRLAVLTELASDDQAIEITRDHVGYAEILLEMAQRSEHTARGPSMARFSTLPLRIDRILLDQVTSCKVSRLQWATLTVGVAAIAMMIANLAPSVVLKPVAASLSDLGFREATAEQPALEASSSTLLPQGRMPYPEVSHDPIPLVVGPAIATTLQVRAVRPRPVAQAPPKSLPTPPIAKNPRGTKLAINIERREASPRLEISDQKKIITDPDDRRNIAAAEIASGDRNQPPLPRETVVDPLLSEIDRLNGSTCVGTVAIGMGAYYQGGQLLEPNVTAGQVVSARAQFFRKADGSSWVRFGSFERPPLDLKLQPTRTGVTWTGEYGITYAVQRVGGDRLIGLAAKIANDSATLSFTCRK